MEDDSIFFSRLTIRHEQKMLIDNKRLKKSIHEIQSAFHQKGRKQDVRCCCGEMRHHFVRVMFVRKGQAEKKTNVPHPSSCDVL